MTTVMFSGYDILWIGEINREQNYVEYSYENDFNELKTVRVKLHTGKYQDYFNHNGSRVYV